MNNSGSLWLPPQKSTLAADTDALFHFINYSGAILLLGIVAVIIYCIIVYKRKSEDDVTPEIHHNNPLEITWSVIPLILVLVVFSWGFKGFLNHRVAPDDAYEIHVKGKKWLWEFSYDNGVTTLNELHVPAGRPVKLIMSSDDVLHSFFIPDYRVKHDVVPGRYTSLWFEVLEPGESVIFCTEYCGDGHSDMMASAIAHEQADFVKWLDSGLKPPEGVPLAEYGEQMYQKSNCWTCHSLDGSKKIGPTFQGIYGRVEQLADGSTITVDENYIRESILEPNAKVVSGYQPVMPSYKGTLKDFQIDALVEFLKGVE